MAYQDQFYTVGTVTVTEGSTAVTGAGTGWETALIVGGVFYAGGGAYPIQSVSSETELTLAIPYVGVDAAGFGYAIDRQRAAAISNIAMNDRLAQIIREISIGNIEDLNALDLMANQILRTDAGGVLSQSDITAAALVLLKLAGAAAADKLPYFNAEDGAALADFTAAARALTNLSGNAANDMFPYLTGANGAALTALTAFARLFLAANNGPEMWAKMGGVRGTASNNIYWTTPGGQLTIAGTTAGTTDANAALTAVFPVAFANANYQIVAIGGEITIPTYNVLWDRAPGACSFQVYNTGGNPRISGAARINYIAIGDA
ncbi:hypothetical protein [Brucella anthropi]|uniref:hypothetical protein n=1 Tax=Brucella anthropi TaxID=529 RepID=UPI001E3176C6|nr:hypothetical protein [Brucella anthropi]UGQ24203.1 hypothetical protein LRL11_18375 [Brucella anthropi]